MIQGATDLARVTTIATRNATDDIATSDKQDKKFRFFDKMKTDSSKKAFILIIKKKKRKKK